jgi:hypothetical protein
MIDVTTQNKILKAISSGMTHREASRAYGVSVGVVSSIRNATPEPIYTDQCLDISRMIKPTYRVMGFPDPHIPCHDKEAMGVALRAQEYFKPDVTIIGNDFVECTPFTRFPFNKLSETEAKDFKTGTINPANKIIDQIQSNTKLTIFQMGNHDAWVERWAARGGGTEKSIYNLVSLEHHLSADRANFIWMKEYGMPIKLHKDLNCIHGWSYCRHAAGKHVALSKTKSVIFHHTHRRQVDTIGDYWDGNAVEALSAGCLCKRKPMYRHDKAPTEWVHGFWVAYIGKESYTAYPVLINKGRAVLPDGKEIK